MQPRHGMPLWPTCSSCRWMNSRSTARSCKTCRIRREAIVRTVVALSQALKLRIIAEGVEHATQVDALVANG